MRVIITAAGTQEVHTSVTMRLDLHEMAKELKIPLRTAVENGLIIEIQKKTGVKHEIIA